MSAYEQAKAERDLARNELEHTEDTLNQMRQAANGLLNDPTSRAHMVQRFEGLMHERDRWEEAYNRAQNAMRRELERHVHEWHGHVVHHQAEADHARTSQERQRSEERLEEAREHLHESEQALEVAAEKQQGDKHGKD